MSVAVSSSHGDITVSPASLTFTASNYSGKQWVTLSAKEDDIAQTAQATISLAASSSGDSDYDDLSGSFTITEQENDTARFVLSNFHSSLTITEGGSHTYSVRLNSQPSADVTVDLAVSGDSEITISTPSSLTFTSSNYGTPQDVTVTTVEDDGEYVSETATVSHSVTGASEYRSLGIGNIAVTARDDDAALFIDTDPNADGRQTTLSLAEGGSSASYEVWLSNQPSGNVTVNLTEAQNPATGNVRVTSPSSKRLTFTTSNWDTKQTVTVRAQSDSDAINGTPTISHAASGGGFDGASSDSVSVIERDSSAAIVIDADSTRSGSQTSVEIPEDGSTTYSVVLAAQPSSGVTVTIAEATTGNYVDEHITVTNPAGKTLAFTGGACSNDSDDTNDIGDWCKPQTVTLSAANDTDLANGRRTIAHNATGGGYDGVPARNLTATEIDKTGKVEIRNAADTADITTLGVPEGGSATYKVKLNVKPTGSVTVRLALQSTSGNDPGDRDITASPTTLYFNTGNWSQAQTVTVRAAQDDDYTIGSRTISHTASGGGFNVTTPVVLTASEVDDEASFLFTNADDDAIAGLTVPEGGSADYYVALSTPPASAVQVTLAATGDISVSPSLVIFTTANWDTAQKVTASAAEEAPAQPSATNKDNTVNEEETITHTASSGDAVYHGKAVALAATGQDNDPGIVIRNAADDAYVTGLDVREGSSAAYTVKLNSPPLTGDVTVTITGKTTVPGNDTDITVDTDASTAGNQNTLTFTAANWNTARTVTVRAANDSSVRKCVPERVFTHTADGGDFSLAPEALLTATELDNDSRHIVLCSVSGDSAVSSLIVPEGVGAPYSVRLNRRPSGNVTVNLSAASSGDADITVSPASLTFTTENWNVPQSASLWAAEDADLVSGYRNVNHTASGHSSATLLAVEQDNDTQSGKTDSISAYDSTATTVLLYSVKGDPTETYYYDSSPVSPTGCVESSPFYVFRQLAPGTEYRFDFYGKSDLGFICRFDSLKASSRTTTKQVTLASSGVTASGATLSVSGWTPTKDGLTRDGDWHYRADKGPDAAACSAGQTGNSVALTGLDSATAYTYTMYQGSDCATSIEVFPSFTTSGQDMTVTTGATTAALTVSGRGSNWYHKHDGAGAACLGPVSGSATGYVTGLARNTEYLFKAYSNGGCSTEIASRRASTRNPALAASGISKNGATLTLSGWIVGAGDGQDGDWHYKANTGPDSSACSTAQTGASVTLSGLTGDTTYSYTAYSDANCAAAITAPLSFTTSLALAASDASATTMLLTLSGYGGDWYYKSTTTGMTGCSGPVSGGGTGGTSSKRVTGLSRNTSYTFTAYSDANCTNANKLDEAPALSTPTPELTTSGVTSVGATLNLSGWKAAHDGNWWYKHGNTGAVCTPNDTTGLSTATTTMTDLDHSTSYTFTAYSDSGCATAIDAAPAFNTPAGTATLLTSEASATTVLLSLRQHSGAWYYKHNVGSNPACAGPVTSGTEDQRVTGLSANTSYTFTAYSDTGCATALDAAPEFTTLDPALAFSNVGSTAATLTLSGWAAGTGAGKDGNWWYKSATTGKTDCTSAASAASVNVAGLTKGATYIFTAYSNSACTTAIVAAPVFVTATTGLGDRRDGKDIALHSDNSDPWGMWSNGTILWVSDYTDDKVYAYNLANGSRNAANDIPSTDLDEIFAIASDGVTLWLSQGVTAHNKLWAYKKSGDTWVRDSGKDISLHYSSTDRTGLWYDSATKTMWIMDRDNGGKLYAYDYSTSNQTWSRNQSKEFDLNTGNNWSAGIWSDGVTMWVANDTLRKVFAYTLATKTRDTGKEFNTHANNAGPADIWSNGKTVWIGDYLDAKLYAYYASTAPGGSPPAKELRVTAAATSATLELRNHTGAWWYQHNVGNNAPCVSVGSGTYTADVTGLTPVTGYTFTAYSDNGCSTVIDAAPAFTTLGYGDRYTSGNITLTGWGSQVWSDGTTVWLSSAGDLEAYKKSDGTRDASKDIDIGAFSYWGDLIFTGDGTTVWTLPAHEDHDDDDDDGHDHDHGGSSEPATSIEAFSITGKARDADKDITLAGTNRDATGMATDGETLWVADHDGARVYAYTLASGARAIGREFTLHADNGLPGGMWTDGALVWVLDRDDGKAYAYNLIDGGSRVPAKDYAALVSNPQGIWSDGATAWILPERSNRLYAYAAHPLSALLRATAGKTTATTAQLELERHTGDWHYKATSGPHTTCSAVQTGTTADLTGLTAGTAYNYKAYSDGNCASEIAAAWPFTTSAPALTASYGDTQATLTLSGWAAGTGAGQDGNWHYKADSGPHTACSATAQTAAAVHLSGLTAGTAYTYTAYSDGNCTSVIDAAPAFTTHANAPALAAAIASATSLQLTLSNYTGPWWYKYTVPATPAGECTAASGATALATGLTKNTGYTFKAYRAGGCATGDLLATAPAKSTSTPTLRVSKIKSRTATLVLEGWDPAVEGSWILQRVGGANSPECSSYYPQAVSVKDKEIRITAHANRELAPNTGYTFKAYASGSSCSGTPIATVSFTTLADPLRPGEFDNNKSWSRHELRSGISGTPEDLWSDGTTLWVFSGAAQKLAAFNLSSKARDSGKDVSVGSVWLPVSMTSDGSTVWVAQRNLNRLWAYSLAGRVRTPGKDITLHADNGDRSALWTDGTTMWVADNEDDKLYAYAVSGGARQRDKEINVAGLDVRAMWSDGTTLWLPDRTWGLYTPSRSETGIYAYKLSDGTRQPAKDYDYWWDGFSSDRIRGFDSDHLAGSMYPTGMWSNGTTTWVSLESSISAWKGIAGYVAIPLTKRLEAGSITATAATLKLHWHTGNWHYKATSGPHTTCSSPAQTGTTASLSGLTSGQSYTYTAYSDSTCTDANKLAEVTFTAQASGAGGASAQARSGAAATGLPVLRIDGAGAAAWEYTLPTGATFVSAELRWVATAGLSAGDWTGAQSRSFTGASVTGHSIAGLQSGVEYKAQVTVSVTVGGAAQSAASATLVFTLPAATAALPGNVATVLAVHNGGNVSALWTGASDATGYEARYSDDNGATWTSATAPSVGTAMTIANLSSGKSYVVGIRATNAAGKGSWTSSAQVSVGASLAAPPSPPTGGATAQTGQTPQGATAQTGPPPGGATAQTGGSTGLAAVLAAINRYFSGEGTLADVHAAMQTYFN